MRDVEPMPSGDPWPMGNTRLTTEERKERISHYRDWAIQVYQMLGLDHWTISFQYAPPEPGVNAQMYRTSGQYAAYLRLSDYWLDDDREGQRRALIHELLHAHMRPLMEITDPLGAVLGIQSYAIVEKQFYNAEETVVDGLARALAPLFPLPPVWPPEANGEVAGEALRFSYSAVFSDGETAERTMVLDTVALGQLSAAVAADLSGRLGATTGQNAVIAGSVARALADALALSEAPDVDNPPESGDNSVDNSGPPLTPDESAL